MMGLGMRTSVLRIFDVVLAPHFSSTRDTYQPAILANSSGQKRLALLLNITHIVIVHKSSMSEKLALYNSAFEQHTGMKRAQ